MTAGEVDFDVQIRIRPLFPCYIGKRCLLINATVGPNVSLGHGCHVSKQYYRNSLVQTHSPYQKMQLWTMR
jgi:glucose-1-phosphate thymidylyltransferase